MSAMAKAKKQALAELISKMRAAETSAKGEKKEAKAAKIVDDEEEEDDDIVLPSKVKPEGVEAPVKSKSDGKISKHVFQKLSTTPSKGGKKG